MNLIYISNVLIQTHELSRSHEPDTLHLTNLVRLLIFGPSYTKVVLHLGSNATFAMCDRKPLMTGSWIRTICWAFPAIWHDVMRRYIFSGCFDPICDLGFWAFESLRNKLTHQEHISSCCLLVQSISMHFWFFVAIFWKFHFDYVSMFYLRVNIIHTFKFQSKQVETSNGSPCFAKRVGSKWWPSSNRDQTCFHRWSHLSPATFESRFASDESHQLILECLNTNKTCLNGKGVHHFYLELMGLQ